MEPHLHPHPLWPVPHIPEPRICCLRATGQVRDLWHIKALQLAFCSVPYRVPSHLLSASSHTGEEGEVSEVTLKNENNLTIRHLSTQLSFPSGIADTHYSQQNYPLRSFICLLAVECFRLRQSEMCLCKYQVGRCHLACQDAALACPSLADEEWQAGTWGWSAACMKKLFLKPNQVEKNNMGTREKESIEVKSGGNLLFPGK